jgi:putative phosphotransacetylase
MKIGIGISARHVHLTREDLDTLFGKNYQLKKYKELTQPGEFAAIEQVNLKTVKGEINNVRIIGPIRNYTQVEITKTDSYVFGIEPPVRDSGNLDNSAIIKVMGPNGSIEKPCCIIAERHIHMNKVDLDNFKVKPNQVVKIKVDTIKGGIMDYVYIKYGEDYKLEMHVDLDDANSHFLTNKDFVEIVKELEKNE